MNSINQNIKTIHLTGYLSITVSLALYLFSFFNDNPASGFKLFDEPSTFFINYIIAIVFFIVVLFDKPSDTKFWKFSRIKNDLYAISLVLFIISALSLNLHIPVFNEFEDWVIVYIIVMLIPLLFVGFYSRLPKLVQYLFQFLMGAGVVLSFYLTMYVFPFIPIGLIGSFVFGLSLHLLAPGLLFIYYIRFFIHCNTDRGAKIAFISGICIPLASAIFLITIWKNELDKIDETIEKINYSDMTYDMPIWVEISQNFNTKGVAGKILFSGIKYQVPSEYGDFSMFPNTRRTNVKKHDPIVYTCFRFFGTPDLTSSEKAEIILNNQDYRELSYPKLWSDNHLSTSTIKSRIDVFPDYRLAYVEKEFTIKNNSNWKGRQEEALYTFYLPEGATASSLSLWVNGVEQKSRLTTRQKADSAYRTIVGVQWRDPALLHWQEGNQLTVTIFPCTPEENRKFKIGITTPLDYFNEELIVPSISFNGPPNYKSKEKIDLQIISDLGYKLDDKQFFKKVEDNKYQYFGKLRPDWKLKLYDTQLSTKKFSFNGFEYALNEQEPELKTHSFNDVILDINTSWSSQQFDQVWELVKDKNVYVYDHELILLNQNSKDDYFERHKNKQYSLLPLYEIEHPESTLIVTSSTHIGPILKSLKNTKFNHKTIECLKKQKQPIACFQLGRETSPYLKTLKEFGAINFSYGNIFKLEQFLQEEKFISDGFSKSNVYIQQSKINISKTPGEVNENAPDHIMRLFAYNQMVRATGVHYLIDNNTINELIIDLAKEAHIVSPQSSMVVLETTQDYEDFDIEKSKNSLENASNVSDGAVPEPHEWALIFICLFFTAWVWKTKRKQLTA